MDAPTRTSSPVAGFIAKLATLRMARDAWHEQINAEQTARQQAIADAKALAERLELEYQAWYLSKVMEQGRINGEIQAYEDWIGDSDAVL